MGISSSSILVGYCNTGFYDKKGNTEIWTCGYAESSDDPITLSILRDVVGESRQDLILDISSLPS